jgi:hypothetical protein
MGVQFDYCKIKSFEKPIAISAANDGSSCTCQDPGIILKLGGISCLKVNFQEYHFSSTIVF